MFFPLSVCPGSAKPWADFALLTLSGTSLQLHPALRSQPAQPAHSLCQPSPAQPSTSLGCPTAPVDLSKTWKEAPSAGVDVTLGFGQERGHAG